MDWTEILIAVGIVGGTGLIVGILLGIAGKLLFVKTDTRVAAIREQLPGSNCGGCGFTGCDAMAKAIAEGKAKPNSCAGCDDEKRKAISSIMGVEDEAAVRRVAFVKCSGTCDKANFIYDYYGINECHRVVLVPGRGSKACAYACTGLGSCTKACRYDAIHIVNGRAFVDREKCIGCGACLRTCPNKLIELIPYYAQYAVRCFSQEKGKVVREMCAAGCIGCGICAKICPENAINIENNIAHIDQSKCSHCGKCAAKCPAHVIIPQYEKPAEDTAEKPEAV